MTLRTIVILSLHDFTVWKRRQTLFRIRAPQCPSAVQPKMTRKSSIPDQAGISGPARRRGRLSARATMVLAAVASFGVFPDLGVRAQEAGLKPESPVPLSYFRGRPLRIGNQIQLLADDYIVEDRWKLQRRVGRVNKFMRNPVIVQDKPWEDAVGAYPSVLHDERLGRYRMWYQCFNLSNYFSKEGPSYYVGYAESEDAFNWTKPRLKGFPFAGHERTNIVYTGRGGTRAAGMQVFLNPDQSDPGRRFVMVYIGSSGVDLSYSPDGFHWTEAPEPLFRYHSDFPNHLLWVPERDLWYLYVRPTVRTNGMLPLPEGVRHTGRRLALSTSPDLRSWSLPRTILYPDERDEPDYDNLYIFRRHGLFIAFYAEMFQEEAMSETVMHVATSRDGIRWERTWNREPLVPRGVPGAFDHGLVEPGTSPPLEVGPDLLIYYYASPVGQYYLNRETGVGVCRLRRDRFIGQQAGDATGYLLTRQFVLEGSRLVINCAALHPGTRHRRHPYQAESDGIRVAIIQAPDFKTRETRWETAVPGFGLEDCDRIFTDHLSHTVTWNGDPDLSRLKGQPVYLRFQLKNADLYSFQVRP